ncbi:cyclic nucleotide-binding/CBS domain-containing protein [Aliidiomarina halalkaliphila]|uniref:Cyclic nucleotide-binding/CBS domain-containing protein n=1 Tax=Aliidiomarina halalkaliphila TaxID=2593535 RepID=A0A552X5Q7_9GAMM|nr:DUF294 nucleotidyltransferase-like domain-containing protein [Aliidiomarina halalkaliphila]TRW50289.1 cyclic nucleotide-binding/CBS domain-containing protein [Aliidiomarina halalkaliphila]
MTSDSQDIRSFLQQTPPFDGLEPDVLKLATDKMQAMYVCQANRDEIIRADRPMLYLVRSGASDLIDKDGQHIERLEPGDLFGYPSLLTGRPITNKLQVIADGIVWTWSADVFDELRRRSQSFERYFMTAHGQRLLAERSGRATGLDWTEKSLASIINRAPVAIGSDASIREAAITMSQERVSCLLVVDDDQLRGILTDRDLRNRVVAAGLSTEVAVAAVMTPMPAVVHARESLFDALTAMSQTNIHHLPVLDEHDRPAGVITATDLMQQQRSEPVLLINALFKAPDRESLVQEAKKIPDYLRSFASRVKDIGTIGRLLTSLTDGMTKKLIRLYEQEHGSAPCAYVWLAFGSQARGDQTLGSDQDNGLLLADSITDGQRQWFAGMATFVCEGLADCGIRLCPGDIMAMNPTWQKTALEWDDQFQKWIRSPTPKAIMHSMIFFDSRAVAGNTSLYRSHRERVAKLAQRDMFLGNIARHIGELSVPLGLFNRFRTKSEGEFEYIDIKKQAIAILNDIVRLYALAKGLTVPSTPERLAQLRGHSSLSDKDNTNLLEAWQFLTQLRLNIQMYRQHEAIPANAIDPETLSMLQRRQLKAAFRVIKDAQHGVAFKFGRNM